MGLRGPGARALKSKPAEAHEAASEPHAWEAKGLTRAERVIRFVETLPITSGMHAGRRLKLRPWQRKAVREIYATDRKGRRPVRTAVISVGRKNGKTQLAAGLALCHLVGPEAEMRGEVVSAANDKAQAALIFREIVAMIERTAWMAERINIKRHDKTLEDIGPGGNGSTYAALSADVPSKMGLSPSFVVYDELGSSSARDLYDALDTAMGARAEPLMLVISTQAARDDAPMSELIDYGLKVRAGEIEDKSFHLTLFTAPMDADPWSPETWALANPALGDFRSVDDVARLARQARRMPSREAAFRNLVLNQRVSAEEHFLTQAAWKGVCGPVQEPLKGRPCWAALDIGGTRDLTALVAVFADDDGGFDVLPVFWMPGDALDEREASDRVPYATWKRQGFLRTTPGRTIDPGFVARDIAELHGRYGFQCLAYDRWRIDDMRRALDAIGCDVELIPHGQGFKEMAPAIDVLERHVVEGRLRTGGHPVLTMCAANARAVSDPTGARKLDKSKSTGRIDGLVALAMALGTANRHEAEPAWTPFCEVA